MRKIFVNITSNKTTPGIVLCLAALAGIIFANSNLSGFYDLFKDMPVMIKLGDFSIDKPLLLWINDGLMAIFFLLIGLEIKREIVEGHLSRIDQIVLPAICAVGGILIPALIYVYFNLPTPETVKGWAIPAATDIAFALGIVLMLGSRVPAALKVCLVAIAIFDDLAAIIIIAIFYTSELSVFSLVAAMVGLAFAWMMNRAGVTKLSPYMVLGLVIWVFVLKSGVHATLAGVALGLIIPIKSKKGDDASPLKELEHVLHPWVAFLIIPVFAFANSGVSLAGLSLESFTHPITLGIMLGLFVGKQIGVMGFALLAKILRICELPKGVNWLQFYGMALLTGIGFTMSLFIGTLAFEEIEHASAVRVGVLSGSLLAAISGTLILIFATKNKNSSN